MVSLLPTVASAAAAFEALSTASGPSELLPPALALLSDPIDPGDHVRKKSAENTRHVIVCAL